VRYHAKVDANHAAIVKALRSVGASVQSLAAVGKGCPDLLVGFGDCWYVLEVKDGSKPQSQCQLTDDEREWAAGARAPVWIVWSIDQALKVIGCHG